MAGALQGVRVLDFTWALAGPFATTQLADLGAEVVRVERTGMAEHQRGLGPHVDGVSTFFFATARGKKASASSWRRPLARTSPGGWRRRRMSS